MAEFQATADDLTEIISIRVRETLRRGAPYPLLAPAIAVATWWFVPTVALVSLGAGCAWAFSLWRAVRGVRADYLWRYAWLQEGVRLRVGDDGVEWNTARGVALTKWNEDLIVRRLGTCFILEDEGEDVAVIPRRYLDATELILLGNRCADASGSQMGAA